MTKRYIVAVPCDTKDLIDAYYKAEYEQRIIPKLHEVSAGGVRHSIVSYWGDAIDHIYTRFDTRAEADAFAERVNLLGFWQMGQSGTAFPHGKATVLGITKNMIWLN